MYHQNETHISRKRMTTNDVIYFCFVRSLKKLQDILEYVLSILL